MYTLLIDYKLFINKRGFYLMKTENYVITSTLRDNFGGRTKALLHRSLLLSKEFQSTFTFITGNYNPNYYQIYELYNKKGHVTSDTNFINIYDYIAARDYHHKKKKRHTYKLKGYDIQEVKEGEIYRYFKNGEYVKYRKFDSESGALIFEDVMDLYNRKRKERLEFNDFGYLARKTIYKTDTLQVSTQLFYDDKGKVYLEKWFKGGKSKPSRIFLFQPNGIKEFQSEKAFFKYVLNLILTDDSNTFCDSRIFDEPLLECKVNTRKFCILHSSHLIDGVIKNSYKYLLNHQEKVDKLIILTEEQREDLLSFGIQDNKLKVIPHSILIKQKHEKNKTESRNNEIVFVGRLEQEKQIDHGIKAFELIADQYPEWIFSIYGDGAEFETLDTLIKERGLQERVTLKGFTDNPKKAFQNAAFSIVTSQYEGFGLIILESINEGCPVLSYDFKYGPKDIIIENQTGKIVEKNNIDELAKGMKDMIDSPLSGEMKLDEKFDETHYLKNWKEALL